MKRFMSYQVVFAFLLLFITTLPSLETLAQPGSLDLSFDPGAGPNSSVNAIAHQADGKIIIGGTFTSYNGDAVNYLARLNANGTRDASFNAGQSGPGALVRAIKIQPDGKILVGGDFNTYNGATALYAIRLNADGSPDPSFDATAAPFNTVHTFCIQPDGKILVGANSRPPLTRLNANGTVDASFHTNINDPAPTGPFVSTIILQGDGKIIAAGDFSFNLGRSVANIIRLNSDGSRDSSFNSLVSGDDLIGTGPNGAIYCSAIQPDGKIIIGGSFTSYVSSINNSRVTTNVTSIARLEPNGTIDSSFNTGNVGLGGTSAVVQAISFQQDGKLLIAGIFNSYNTSVANDLARLNANGTLDNSFTGPGVTSSGSTITCISIEPSNAKFLIGGSFTSYNNIGRNSIARIYYAGDCVVGSIAGPNRACAYTVATGNSATYNIIAPTGSTYAWTVSNPATMNILNGQGTNSIQLQYANNFTSGVVYVRVSNTSCGFIVKPYISVNSNPPSAPGTITAGSNSICAYVGTPNTISYKINKVASATSYNWFAQAGSTTITHPNGPGVNDTIINVSFANNFTSSQVTVQAVNDCGSSNIRTLNINFVPPSAPASISGPVHVCDYLLPAPVGPKAVYAVTPVAGITYNWTIPAGAGSVVGQGTNSIAFYYPAGFTTGTVSVTATNDCGTSNAKSIPVKASVPQTPGAITTTMISDCPNRIYTYSIAAIPVNANSVVWTAPAGGTITAGQGTTTITITYGLSAVNGYVSLQSFNSCGASAVRKISVTFAACTLPTPFAKNGSANSGSITNSNNIVPTGKTTTDLILTNGMEVKVFPNPSASDFNFQVITTGNEAISLKIFDIEGRFISATSVPANMINTIGAKLGTGIYYLEVKQGVTIKTVRLVKL